ncbi:hypothetical protein EK0264_10605 [Epidermidibacterium keratini]|uniref:SH3b domain-containing protein n=2 Tax=Epidermidibacterium keratini TaxID=1891644 RepID=A0A7L4YT15_9ACTN|nr:hypothetical protein EK0264_10605 [Epidermidibacterium keratini]
MPVPAGSRTLVLDETQTKDFASAGISWVGDAPVDGIGMQVRTKSAETGEWSDWNELTVSRLVAANPDAPEQRQGSDPFWFGDSNGVEVAVTVMPGTQISDLKITLIDPKQVAQDADPTAGAPTSSAGAAMQQPPVYTRAAWGADESKMTWAPKYASTIKAATLHHTADTNNYSAADVPAMMRSIYQYQAVTLGWGDIGYNVVIDKFGRAWEGRSGGLETAVQGAHAGGFNTYTFGLSMLGNYDTVDVPQATRDTLAQWIAWKFSLFNVDPLATTQLTQQGGNGTTAKFQDGQTVTLPTVFGHRDTGYTACPGRYGYAILPWLRQRASELIPQISYSTDTKRTMLTNTGGVPVRGGPGLLYGMVGSLSAGTFVTADSTISNGYIKVSGNGVTGWVDQKWLVQDPHPNSARYTTTSGVPVYAGPGSGYLALGQASVNTAFYTDGVISDGYVRVHWGKSGGWVPQQWLTTTRPGGLAIPSGNPTSTRPMQTNTNGIPVYSGPSTSQQIGTLSAGIPVTAGYEVIGGYVHISFGSNGGWVPLQWMSSNPLPTQNLFTTTGGIQVYFGPGNGYAKGDTLSAGTPLAATGGSVNGYVWIVYGDVGGWIEAKWTSTYPRGNPVGERFVATNTGGVPVYSEPSTASTVRTTYSGNTVLQAAYAEYNGMTHIQYGTTGGWVPSQWLTTNPGASSVALTNTGGVPVYLGPGSGYTLAGYLPGSQQVGLSAEAPVGGYRHITYGQTGGWLSTQWLATNPTSVTGTVYTNTGGVPVHLGPGSGYDLAGSVSANTALAYSGAPQNGYVQVRYGSYGGWVAQKWVIQNPTPVSTMTATTSGISAYLGPGTGYYRIGEISQGTKVQVGAERADGYMLIVFGNTGAWVPTKWFS